MILWKSKVIPFPLEKRPEWAPLDNERVLKYGKLVDTVLEYEDVEEKWLLLAIEQGDSVRFQELKKRVKIEWKLKQKVEKKVFEYLGTLESRITAGNLSDVLKFFSIVSSLWHIEWVRELILSKLSLVVDSPFFLIKPLFYVQLYTCIWSLPESIISHYQGFRLQAQLERNIIQAAKVSLEHEKQHPYQLWLTYSSLFGFFNTLEKHPQCSGVIVPLTSLFEQHYIQDIEVLAGMCTVMQDMTYVAKFFDGIYVSFPEARISKYFYKILSAFFYGDHKDNVVLKKTVWEILLRYSFNLTKIHDFLRHNFSKTWDFDALYTVFIPENWGVSREV